METSETLENAILRARTLTLGKHTNLPLLVYDQQCRSFECLLLSENKIGLVPIIHGSKTIVCILDDIGLKSLCEVTQWKPLTYIMQSISLMRGTRFPLVNLSTLLQAHLSIFNPIQAGGN